MADDSLPPKSVDSDDNLEDAVKAISAYERIVLATEASFQQSPRGEVTAKSVSALRGANLLFDKAGRAACHHGAALNSAPGASEEKIFCAVGFADFDQFDGRQCPGTWRNIKICARSHRVQKNIAQIQQANAVANLDPRFRPLGLSGSEISELTSFLTDGLVDENLKRQVPDELASGKGFPVADQQARADLGCE